jgi:uncharacterized protein
MHVRVATGLVLALLSALAMPALANEKATGIVSRAIDGFIRPGYANFHAATGNLVQAEKALCDAPSQKTLDAARRSFGETVDAWSAIEIIRFGPVTEDNRLERVLFWPDRKSTGLKQVQAALAAKDETATTVEGLAQKSVAMQGLGALEFVLFGTGSEGLATGEAYRCSYGAAIAGNLDTIAAELETAWNAKDGFAKQWANPGPDDPLYRTGTEAVSELMDVFVTGFELVRDVRLGGFLGETPDKNKPKQALFWRSGKTVDAIAANLAGMKKLFEASQLGEAVRQDALWIGKSALFEFGNAAQAAAAANGPINEVLADPKRRDKLVYLGLVTSSLSDVFGTTLSGELGLTSGFSSLDGD